MKWVEVIKLRSAGKVPESLRVILSGLLENGPSGLTEARLYRHALWEMDWSLHLHWESDQPEKEGSAIGLRLSQGLEEFGMVDHSIWVERV